MKCYNYEGILQNNILFVNLLKIALEYTFGVKTEKYSFWPMFSNGTRKIRIECSPKVTMKKYIEYANCIEADAVVLIYCCVVLYVVS